MAVLAAFLLLAPPLYFLGPFAALLLLAGIRARREVLAFLAASIGIVVWVTGAAGLGLGLLRASGMALALAFGVLSLRGRGPVLARAGAALLVAVVAIAAWCGIRGVGWNEVERAFATMLVEAYRSVPNLTTNPATRQELETLIRPVLEAVPRIARLMPGLLALQALAGIGLAALWQHRISRVPTGTPPLPFRRFRFNDHMVWGAIFTLASLLAPLPPVWRALAENLLVVWAGLYAIRGLAVFSALLARAPVILRIGAVALAVLLNLVALGTCMAIGLADTWLDIRKRLLPSASEGVP